MEIAREYLTLVPDDRLWEPIAAEHARTVAAVLRIIGLSQLSTGSPWSAVSAACVIPTSTHDRHDPGSATPRAAARATRQPKPAAAAPINPETSPR